MKKKDGTHLWVNVTIRLHRDEKGRPIERRGIVEDITARKRIEEKLLFSKYVIDHAGDAVLWAGSDKRILYANEEAHRSLGYDHGELIGVHLSEISPTHNPKTFLDHIENLHEKPTLTYESVHRKKDGKEFPIEITLSALKQDQNTYTCAIVRDISKRKTPGSLTRRSKGRSRNDRHRETPSEDFGLYLPND